MPRVRRRTGEEPADGRCRAAGPDSQAGARAGARRAGEGRSPKAAQRDTVRRCHAAASAGGCVLRHGGGDGRGLRGAAGAERVRASPDAAAEVRRLQDLLSAEGRRGRCVLHDGAQRDPGMRRNPDVELRQDGPRPGLPGSLGRTALSDRGSALQDDRDRLRRDDLRSRRPGKTDDRAVRRHGLHRRSLGLHRRPLHIRRLGQALAAAQPSAFSNVTTEGVGRPS